MPHSLSDWVTVMVSFYLTDCFGYEGRFYGRMVSLKSWDAKIIVNKTKSLVHFHLVASLVPYGNFFLLFSVKQNTLKKYGICHQQRSSLNLVYWSHYGISHSSSPRACVGLYYILFSLHRRGIYCTGRRIHVLFLGLSFGNGSNHLACSLLSDDDVIQG